jgi:hypothetical protein
MPADDSTSPNGSRGDDPHAALIDRRDRAQRELDESVAIMNADAYLMTSRLPSMAVTKDQALHELTSALTALKVTEHGGDDAEIERGQWHVIDAARTLCQVTAGNVVELGNLMTAGLASYNTAVTNMATVIDIHTALTRSLDDPPLTPNTSDDTVE